MNRGDHEKYIRDKGGVDFNQRRSEHIGEIMKLATRDVVTVPPTMTIMGAVKTMANYTCRRLPVTDAGTNKLIGIVTSHDIIDFMGGGEKNQLLVGKYDRNIIAGINAEVREIMNENPVSIPQSLSIMEAIDILKSEEIGSLPITDKSGRVNGIVTVRDFVEEVKANESIAVKSVADYMNHSITTASLSTPIRKIAKIMVGNRFHRVPITDGDGKLVGVVTTSDLIRYISSGEIFEKLITGDLREASLLPVEIIMRREAITTTSDSTLGEVAEAMIKHNIGALPVMENNEFVGIITEQDLLDAF
ncbi:MAG: histidine kinase [Candidatus Syntrophoarchaeum caldarius]|uniref:Histidine kinase n=1 Tax=Candidatus Syntropharchaeum caldarium TaxID=1838285 RepID=A0A1F2PAJ4_9EURY|nr:MAG: histidine kinase [Candidatus Syntrophoarchaeum caldarius]